MYAETNAYNSSRGARPRYVYVCSSERRRGCDCRVYSSFRSCRDRRRLQHIHSIHVELAAAGRDRSSFPPPPTNRGCRDRNTPAAKHNPSATNTSRDIHAYVCMYMCPPLFVTRPFDDATVPIPPCSPRSVFSTEPEPPDHLSMSILPPKYATRKQKTLSRPHGKRFTREDSSPPDSKINCRRLIYLPVHILYNSIVVPVGINSV